MWNEWKNVNEIRITAGWRLQGCGFCDWFISCEWATCFSCWKSSKVGRLSVWRGSPASWRLSGRAAPACSTWYSSISKLVLSLCSFRPSHVWKLWTAYRDYLLISPLLLLLLLLLLSISYEKRVACSPQFVVVRILLAVLIKNVGGGVSTRKSWLNYGIDPDNTTGFIPGLYQTVREYCRQGTDERLGDLPARFNEEPLIVKDFLVVHAFVVHAEAVHCSWEICRTCSSVCHYARLLLSVFFMCCICIRDTSIASFFVFCLLVVLV